MRQLILNRSEFNACLLFKFTIKAITCTQEVSSEICDTSTLVDTAFLKDYSIACHEMRL